jgi:TonB family protein
VPGRSGRWDVNRPAISGRADRAGAAGSNRGQPSLIARNQIEPNMSASGQPSSSFSGVRRRIPRYSVAIPVDITVLRSGAPASIPGRSLDLGEGGVAAVLAAELQLGEWVGVEFQLPNAVQALQTKAVVRHHNQLRCGFEFLGLSSDQRSMIRRWAGNSQPLPTLEPKPLEPSKITPATLPHSSTAVSTAGATKLPAPVPAQTVTHVRRQPVSASNRAVERLLRLTLVLLLVVGGWAAWQWHRGWQQLEARMARKDAHAQLPSAKVPAEVMERLLVRKVDPVYPEAARRSNLQGAVVLDAVIAADGTVVNLHPVSGADALISAAMDAARWWRFRPYRVRGEPATVETTLSVEFRP